MNINPNDLISFSYLIEKTNIFTLNELRDFYKNSSYQEINVLLGLLYEISDHDYKLQDPYVKVLLENIKNIVKF